MTRTEYMAQLEKYLKKLPHKEFQEAITFFNEYFDEAGPEKETAIMEELGSPKEAARSSFRNYSVQIQRAYYLKTYRRRKRRAFTS